METQSYGYELELGRGKNHSVNEVAEMFGITPVYKDGKIGEARHTLNKDKTTKRILGWVPTQDLKDYINTLNL